MPETTQLRPYQVCRSNDGWQPVRISSESDPERTYTVLVSPWGRPTENMCECPGYAYRGYCKHQREAANKVCRWSEKGNLASFQDGWERREMVCPRCGGDTKWEIEVIDEPA